MIKPIWRYHVAYHVTYHNGWEVGEMSYALTRPMSNLDQHAIRADIKRRRGGTSDVVLISMALVAEPRGTLLARRRRAPR